MEDVRPTSEQSAISVAPRQASTMSAAALTPAPRRQRYGLGKWLDCERCLTPRAYGQAGLVRRPSDQWYTYYIDSRSPTAARFPCPRRRVITR
jgi:hypothetical protein